MNEQQYPTLWTTGFLPNGFKVSFTIPIADPDNAYAIAMQFTNKLLADGFLLNEPGLGDGERKESVNAIVRREKTNRDESVTPIIDLYVGRNNFSFLRVYLNTPEDVQAFEQACSVVFDKMQLYEGDAAIERSKNPDKDRKYVVRLPYPVNVAYIHNPDYVEGGKQQPKRLFVRWLSSQNAAESHENAPNSSAAPETAMNEPVDECGMKLATFKRIVEHTAFTDVESVRKHREAIVRKLWREGYYADCKNIGEAVEITLSRPDKFVEQVGEVEF